MRDETIDAERKIEFIEADCCILFQGIALEQRRLGEIEKFKILIFFLSTNMSFPKMW